MPGYRHVFHLYVIETKKPGTARRAAEVPVKTAASTPRRTTRSRSTSRKVIRGASGAASSGSVANAERNAATCVSLPMFPELTAEEVDYVIAEVHGVGQERSGTG